MPSFRVVGVWMQGPGDPNTSRVMNDDLETLSPQDMSKLVAYLRSMPVLIRSTALLPDPLSADETPRVPQSVRTDGVWLWDDSVEYFALHYRLSPDRAFVNHALSSAAAPQSPTRERQAEILRELLA